MDTCVEIVIWWIWSMISKRNLWLWQSSLSDSWGVVVSVELCVLCQLRAHSALEIRVMQLVWRIMVGVVLFGHGSTTGRWPPQLYLLLASCCSLWCVLCLCCSSIVELFKDINPLAQQICILWNLNGSWGDCYSLWLFQSQSSSTHMLTNKHIFKHL